MVVVQVKHSSSSVTTTSGDGTRRTRRYQSGWKDNQQETKIKTRAAQVAAQSFEEIRDKCLADGVLWQDPDFPPVNQSVYYSTQLPQSFQWKRPSVCMVT